MERGLKMSGIEASVDVVNLVSLWYVNNISTFMCEKINGIIFLFVSKNVLLF